MIRNLKLHNFKIHKDLNLNLNSLTVFAGYNSAGKSSVIQALLLIRQNKMSGNLSDSLDLKGDLCQIGLCKDVLCQQAEEQQITFELTDESGVNAWSYDIPNSSMQKSFCKCSSCKEEEKAKSNLFSDYFQYISVARWAPRESYPLDSKAVEKDRQISKINGQGELTPHFLHHYSREESFLVPDALYCEGCFDPNLLSQTSAWEGLISSAINVKPTPTGTDFRLNYSYNTPTGESVEFSAINVGSGISFVLPIIVALLSTPKGGLVIIENPEAHLHPQGQASLARLIAKAAQYGIQVVIETHSDYILNGILISCQEFEQSEGLSGVSKDNVAIYQFVKNEDAQLSEPIPVHLAAGGTICNQPKGFFEQMELDMNQLLNL